MKHCNKELEIKTGKENGKNMFYAECSECGLKYKATDKKNVEIYFKNNQNNIGKNAIPQQQNMQLAPLPKNRNTLQTWQQQNMPALLNQSAQFIDKPATERMIQKNVRYITNLSGKSWDKIWSTPEGQETILHGFTEALYYGAILGEMGDLVPFGNTAEFIPAIECFENALQTGKNPPFSNIRIYPIHENDTRKAYQKDGNFTVDLEYGIPRGEVIAIVVQAVRNDTGYTVGEIYDTKRLLEKAAHHSPSYRNYIIEKEDFQRLKTEGKLKKDENGREYMEKKFTNWTKKIYEHDIINPYDGPDRPEMLRKAAGKSFFRPYMKVRNASAMADEWKEDDSITDDTTIEQAADHVLDKAMGQFDNVQPPIKDAEIVENGNNKNDTKNQKVPENEKNNQENKNQKTEKEVEKKEAGLFNEDKEIEEL